jgi:hypothetical protein
MATRYAPLARCSEIPEKDVIAALVSRGECAALLQRIAADPSARSAARALLELVGRLATPACAWLEGELAVELFEENEGMKVRVMSELGAGLRERVLPAITIGLALDDLLVIFEKRRYLTALLRVERVSSRCALLLASPLEAAPMSTDFDISETSLSFGGAGYAADDVDAGWDDASVA